MRSGREAQRAAMEALEAGRPLAGVEHLWPFVDRSHLSEDELERYLRLMLRCYREGGRDRAAATIAMYLGDAERAEAWVSDVPTDRARCAAIRGEPAEAARHYEAAGWLGHAAIQLEDAADLPGARVLWERLAADPRCRANPYVAGLVQYDLARCCQRLGDAPAARQATVATVHQLEAAADGFETRGLRERAFDCFQVILSLGRGGAFENLAEGYLNCIRILAEDNLRYYALQYYEDFQRAAIERGELRAAATLFAEAADFARRHALPHESHYRLRAAETHVMAAERAVGDGSPLDLVENAYAAAIATYSDLGAYGRARTLYEVLAELPLDARRRDRYARLAERVADMQDRELQPVPFPKHLRMETAYPEIWRLDVIEWEQGGSAAEAMGEVLTDPGWPPYTRRLALLCRLEELGAEDGGLSPFSQSALAGRLGRVGIYPALAPVEHLFQHDDPRVRAACMRAVRELFFKRSFVLVMRGLDDPHPDVRREAVAAVRALHFVHAFDPLARIYRRAVDRDVRRAALESIGHIQTQDARDLLAAVARYADPADRELAARLLRSHPSRQR